MSQSYGSATARPRHPLPAVLYNRPPAEAAIRLTDNPSFMRFLFARLAGGFAMQIQVVAVGWKM